MTIADDCDVKPQTKQVLVSGMGPPPIVHILVLSFIVTVADKMQSWFKTQYADGII